MATNHYDQDYFNWQMSIGKGNKRLVSRFQKYIDKNNLVLDFGCGGGFLLSFIDCKNKIGFDINEVALKHASKLGINTYNNLKLIENDSVDVIISNSALEHVPSPIETLKELKTKLKPNGKIVFSVPHETLNWDYKINDVNYHLHTWSPMAIGNLFNEAGFKNMNVKIFREKGLPNEHQWSKFASESFISFLRKPYRIFRLVLDELKIRPIGVDGDIVVYAEK